MIKKGCRGCWGQWGHWDFGVESWNLRLNYSSFSVGGCWGQQMLLFWKQVVETQMPTTHEATRRHNSKNVDPSTSQSHLVLLIPLWDTLYRVSHIETSETKWLWEVEGSTFFWIMVPSGFMSSGHLSFISVLKKWHRLASTASDMKGAKFQYDISWFHQNNIFLKTSN